MPDDADVERIGIELMSKLGTNQLGSVIAWITTVTTIIERFEAKVTPHQYSLLIHVYERWGLAVPFIDDPGPRIWMRSEAADIEAYFSGTLLVAQRIRSEYERLPHAAPSRDRDALLLDDVEAFCTEKMTLIQELSSQGDFYCEPAVFENLAKYCKDLLRVVLGDELLNEFAEEYDRAMKVLADSVKLINAPEV